MSKGLSLHVSEALHRKFQRRCKDVGVYASGVMKVLATMFAEGRLTEGQLEEVVTVARVQAGRHGRGWTLKLLKEHSNE